jgi:hypothetical protein
MTAKKVLIFIPVWGRFPETKLTYEGVHRIQAILKEESIDSQVLIVSSEKEHTDLALEEGFLVEECNSCGFHERRVVDYRVPLVLNFKNRNNRNWLKENLEFLCYNCYFLHVGNIWSNNQLAQLEEYTKKDTYNNDKKPDFDLDENHIEHLKELGLWDDSDEDEFIDRL